MNFCNSAAIVAALILVSGCAMSRVSDEFFVQTERLDRSSSGAIGETEVPLGPGDVLYLRRGWPGAEGAGSAMSASRSDPFAYTDRIPLRRVGHFAGCGDAGATGRLYPYERAFLSAVLAANRIPGPDAAGSSDGGDDLSVQDTALSPHAVALWNCLVENLTVRRRVADGDGEAGSTEQLQLAVNMDGLLSALPDDSPTRATFRAGVQQFPRNATSGTPGRSEGATSLEMERPPRLQLATVELNGISIVRPGWPERQWTLREWDEAGVLFDRNDELARLLVVRFSQRGDRFYVAECFGLDPTHRVEVANQDGRPTRELIRERKGFAGWFKVLHQGAAIPQANLDDLVIANVRSVEVGTGERCDVR